MRTALVEYRCRLTRGVGAFAGCLTVLIVAGVGLLAQQDEALSRYRPSKNDHYMQNFYFPPAPSSTPWWPAWAPDGKSIAVAMQGSIWQIDPSTGAAIELVTNRKYLSS